MAPRRVRATSSLAAQRGVHTAPPPRHPRGRSRRSAASPLAHSTNMRARPPCQAVPDTSQGRGAGRGRPEHTQGMGPPSDLDPEREPLQAAKEGQRRPSSSLIVGPLSLHPGIHTHTHTHTQELRFPAIFLLFTNIPQFLVHG